MLGFVFAFVEMCGSLSLSLSLSFRGLRRHRDARLMNKICGLRLVIDVPRWDRRARDELEDSDELSRIADVMMSLRFECTKMTWITSLSSAPQGSICRSRLVNAESRR